MAKPTTALLETDTLTHFNSGKTSLALSLFGMMDVDEGSVKIDSIDISRVPHSHLRTSLVAVSQDIPILEGIGESTYSVRVNVDPSGTHTDEKVVEVLKKVQLWTSLEMRGGLDTSIEGDSFSQGQLQLLALARAMLRSSRILVLDEATSRYVICLISDRPSGDGSSVARYTDLCSPISLDDDTSAIINEVLRSWFAQWTVIAIAHKLESILDFDRVAVLDDGHLVEFGQPRILLDEEGSRFNLLYGPHRKDVAPED